MRKTRSISSIALLIVAIVFACAGCKIGDKTTEMKQQNQNFEKKLMEKLATAEKRARRDSQNIEENVSQVKQSLAYIGENIDKAEDKEEQLELMENSSYLYNLIFIKKDTYGNENPKDKESVKLIEKQNITKMSRALYDYLLSSGEADSKEKLSKADKYMKDIKKAGLDSEVKKLIGILAKL